MSGIDVLRDAVRRLRALDDPSLGDGPDKLAAQIEATIQAVDIVGLLGATDEASKASSQARLLVRQVEERLTRLQLVKESLDEVGKALIGWTGR